jgi:hypothetical protein
MAGGAGGADRVADLLGRALDEVEPLLHRSADLVLTTTAPTAELADVLLGRLAELRRANP